MVCRKYHVSVYFEEGIEHDSFVTYPVTPMNLVSLVSVNQYEYNLSLRGDDFTCETRLLLEEKPVLVSSFDTLGLFRKK